MRKIQGMSDDVVLNWKIRGYEQESVEYSQDKLKENELIVGTKVGLNKHGGHPSYIQFLIATKPRKI